MGLGESRDADGDKATFQGIGRTFTLLKQRHVKRVVKSEARVYIPEAGRRLGICDLRKQGPN